MIKKRNITWHGELSNEVINKINKEKYLFNYVDYIDGKYENKLERAS